MKKQELNSLYHCVYSLNYHLVMVTRYRKRCISPELLARLEVILGDLLTRKGCELLEFNGETDHVHLLIGSNPKIELSSMVNNLKTVSSRLIRKEFSEHLKPFFWKPFFWSRSYCIISCGGAPLSIIKQYIEQQGES